MKMQGLHHNKWTQGRSHQNGGHVLITKMDL